MTATTEDAFFHDIREHPEDDVPRLVYADWLEEHGGEQARARAELIRVQCRLERLPEEDQERAGLALRSEELLSLLRAGGWLANRKG